MRPLLATLLLILLSATSAFADSPIPPHTWERVVGPYRFVMLSPYDRTPQAAEGRTYPAAGLYRTEGPPEPLWTVDWYAHEGDLFLSPDGEYLTRMGPWPTGGKFDELAVAFYQNGALTKAYLVKDLVEKPEELPQSVSHYAWREAVFFDSERLRLSVTTIPGTTYLLDARTGAILSPSADLDEKGPSQQIARGSAISGILGGLVVAGGLWLLLARMHRP